MKTGLTKRTNRVEKNTIHSKEKEPVKQRCSNEFVSAIVMKEEEVMLRKEIKHSDRPEGSFDELSINFSSILLSCFFI